MEAIIVNMACGWGRWWAIKGLSKSVAKDILSSCFGASASLYQAPLAAFMILNLTPADNSASLTV
ncbi:NADPH-dependent pterin aldehyde reductase [Glycine soja]|uniref:Uncharacterized protein n=2 Tax=Glycine subgen. Soja TaxID=1462606 RepID=K7L435_SOYBN|nr:NADPH-dependent pterin aldehyde reductase [Glycine soja]